MTEPQSPLLLASRAAVEWTALAGAAYLGVGRGRWWSCFTVAWLGVISGSLVYAVGESNSGWVTIAALFGWVPAVIFTLGLRWAGGPLWGLARPWFSTVAGLVRGRR
jgi:hypothetical protein